LGFHAVIFMSKKDGFALIMLVFLAGMAFSAGSSQQASKTITLYYWDANQKAAMDSVVAAYTASSGVKVETTIIPYGQYWTKLQTSLPSENGPDVFWINYSHALDYYPAGLVSEIQTYVDRDKVDITPFPQSLIEMYSYNDKLYGIPKDYDTIAIFYNKAMFDAKGVPYPKAGWTWDDFRNTALALTDASKDEYGFGVVATEQEVVFPWVFSNDGNLLSADKRTFNFNTPQTIETLQWLMNLIHVDQVSPTYAQLKELRAGDRFLGGKLAMISDGSWSVKDFSEALGDNLGIVEIPRKRRVANVIHGLSFAISSKSKNKEEAWGLLKAFASKDAGAAQASAVIPAYEGATQMWKDHFPKLDVQIFIDGANIANPFATPLVAASAQSSAMFTMFEKIWNGADVATACAELDAECRKLVADSGK
jgi:multiple sugar transport system substrate-binding protein